MPCIETYQKVDLRTITLGVPPQEVSTIISTVGKSRDNAIHNPDSFIKFLDLFLSKGSKFCNHYPYCCCYVAGVDQGQRDSVGGRSGVLQGQ